MIIAIVVLFILVILQGVAIYLLYKRPYIDIDEKKEEFILKANNYELTRFVKLEKK